MNVGFESTVIQNYIIHTSCYKRKNPDGLDLVKFVHFSEFRHFCSRVYKTETGHPKFKTKSRNEITLCQDNRVKISRAYFKKHGYERPTKPYPFFGGRPVYCENTLFVEDMIKDNVRRHYSSLWW